MKNGLSKRRRFSVAASVTAGFMAIVAAAPAPAPGEQAGGSFQPPDGATDLQIATASSGVGKADESSEPSPRAVTPIEWCQTQVKWSMKAPPGGAAAGVCPTEGICDNPAVRNTWIPDAATPIVSLCIKFNVFCETNGSNCAASGAAVAAQLNQLNADFLPSRVQFQGSTEFINDSTFRSLEDSVPAEVAMKSTYADNPAGQLNVYVVNIEGGYLGVGTFPWDPDSLGSLGGIIIDDNFFGAGEKTLTHEAGHCIGLWHTHHGVSEVPPCSACYERANGVEGDTTGDFASDTDPTPTNFACGPPVGNDDCSGGMSWGPTDPQNYMSYAPDTCYSEFSPHQFGRVHCWIDDELQGWYCDTTGACCVAESCTVRTQAACTGLGGDYLGDDTTCDGEPGDLHVYPATVNLPIPDDSPANPATHMINVPDSFTVGDVDVGLVINHTWVGDLIATVSHGGTTVAVVDRPGFPAQNFGCGLDNLNVILDDEGTGGAIEDQCVNDLSSPPNYTPNQALSAFDGISALGTWTIAVSDNAQADTGTLVSWSLRIREQGAGPCAAGCTSDAQCGDPALPFCDLGTATCVECLAGAHCADGNACTTDTCSAGQCSILPNSLPCSDGLFCNGADTCSGGACSVHAGSPCGDPNEPFCDETSGCVECLLDAHCNDGLPCTVDRCDGPPGSCSNTVAPLPGDYDANGQLQLADYGHFPGCFAGVTAGPAPDCCEVFDFDFDSDRDLADFAAWANAYSALAP